MDEEVLQKDARLHLALLHERWLLRGVVQAPKRLHWVVRVRMQHQQAYASILISSGPKEAAPLYKKA
jgi:hypothetical protein